MYSINFSENDKHTTQLIDNLLTVNDASSEVDIIALPQGGYSVKAGNKSYHLHIESIDYKSKTVTFNKDNKLIPVEIEEPIDLLLKKMGINTANSKKLDNIKAPMPGLILNIMVKEGDVIKKGQPILVLEAMKMENVFKAPGDATIKAIKVNVGDAVEKGAVMLELM